MMDEKNKFSDENFDMTAEELHAMETTSEADVKPQKQPATKEAKRVEPSIWLNRDEKEQLRSRWSTIQTQFVDQPRGAVEQAETLIADCVERIQQLLVDQQTRLSEQWCYHADTSTEDLRLIMQNYRSFLDHLLDH